MRYGEEKNEGQDKLQRHTWIGRRGVAGICTATGERCNHVRSGCLERTRPSSGSHAYFPDNTIPKVRYIQVAENIEYDIKNGFESGVRNGAITTSAWTHTVTGKCRDNTRRNFHYTNAVIGGINDVHVI